MINPRISSSSLIPLLLLLAIMVAQSGRFAEAGKRRIHISDDLDDVTDDEEDDTWKEWGKKTTPSREFDPPPMDMSRMELSEIQAEMMKRHTGPSFGFVKLRLGGRRRSPEMVAEIAMKWTKVLRTGSIEAKFMGVDLSTIMFTMEKGQDIAELKEFVLNQPEAYEIKIGDQVFRRPGDPPLEEVVEMLRSEENKEGNTNAMEDDGHLKDEL